MPVFDFTHTPDEKKPAECTYTVFYSNEQHPTADNPLMVLERLEEGSCHHPVGLITNPIKKTAFEYTGQNGTVSANILKMDARFVGLFKWLGESHIKVRLTGENREEGYVVYKVREVGFGGCTKLSAEDGFLQFMIERLLASDAPADIEESDDEEDGDKANHAVEDDLVQQRSVRDDLGRRLGLGTHGVDMRGDDYLLAATRIVGDARGNVLGHDVLRDTTRTHLRQDGIVVVLGEIHEEATDEENQADDEHAERNARHEDADARNDRT